MRFSMVVVGMLVLGACVHAPVAGNDVAKLLALHEEVMEAHRSSNPGPLVGTDPFVVASRGEITWPGASERFERFQRYLGSTTFSEYRDLVPPVVKVSRDGTLGWVIVQVSARGVQRLEDGGTRDVNFVSAWIELYEKQDGRWVAVGNVSNFKE